MERNLNTESTPQLQSNSIDGYTISLKDHIYYDIYITLLINSPTILYH